MAMAPPRLLRGLFAPLSPADWLPCHQQLLTSAALLHRWWIPSLARLRCSDGFKLFLVLLLVSVALAEVRYVASASMAPTLRPGDRAVAEKRLPQGHVFIMGDARNTSCDSRAWGALPISNILGRYMMSFTRSSLQ